MEDAPPLPHSEQIETRNDAWRIEPIPAANAERAIDIVRRGGAAVG
jgi:hypothetical protein